MPSVCAAGLLHLHGSSAPARWPVHKPISTAFNSFCICGRASMLSPETISLQMCASSTWIPVCAARLRSISSCRSKVFSYPSSSSARDLRRYIAYAIHHSFLSRCPIKKCANCLICASSSSVYVSLVNTSSRRVFVPWTSSSILMPKYSDSFLSVGRLMFSALRLNHELTALGLIPHSFANFRRDIPFALIRDCKLSVNAIQNSTPFPAKRWRYHVC